MSDLYEGCWHKLDRAKKHVDALKRDIHARITHPHAKPPFWMRKEFYPDLNCFTVTISGVESPPTEWSLVMGDALTNFRAALDYLAHDLVGRGTKPHLRGTATPQFVICQDSKDVKGQINGRMPGIQASHRTIIEDYQPYRWLAVKEHHPFTSLDALVRRDKHREIEPVFSQHTGSLKLRIVGASNFIVERIELGRDVPEPPMSPPLEPDTELWRIYGRRTGSSDPEVRVQIDSSFGIAFQNGLWVQDTLDGIGAMIAQLFSEVEPTL